MSASESDSPRIEALDLLRGLVIVLMTVDHASATFNAGRFALDSSFMWTPGTAIPAAQFMLRWLTHLCAPSFVFVAGTSLALSNARRLARGESQRTIDGALLRRGAFIALLDPLWMSLAFVGRAGLLLQVLYALGVSMMLMVPLRRLSQRVLLCGALAYCLGSELLAGLGLMLGGAGEPAMPVALLLTGGLFKWQLAWPARLIVAYPALPWLALMVLGHAFGTHLLTPGATQRVARRLALSGTGLLAVFVVVRFANDYGNMRLLRDDLSLLQWLHVNKYPPGLSYVTLELGLAALLLSGAFLLRRPGAACWLAPLRLLGQTSLFFYLIHAHLLIAAATALGMHERAGIGVTLVAALITLVALYPLCVRYARYKQAHPTGLARYI